MCESKRQVVHEINQPLNKETYVVFWCPGCRRTHMARTKKKPGFVGPVWTWNGDTDKPTIDQSVLINQADPSFRCHSKITDGYIEYLNDCAHHLANHTIELPSFVFGGPKA